MYSDAEISLLENVSWFLVSGHGTAELTMAAAEALVEGLDTPSLRDLAGLEPGSSCSDVRVVALAAFDELGLPYPNLDTDDGQLFVLRVLCRRYQDRALSPRELTSWAHANIGHEGARVAQDLVMLDDELDEIGTPWRSIADVHAEIEVAAATFLANYPRE